MTARSLLSCTGALAAWLCLLLPPAPARAQGPAVTGDHSSATSETTHPPGGIEAVDAPASAVKVQEQGWGPWLRGYVGELLEQLGKPLFWFGIGAQFLFFLRFVWQWIVSERRKRSTIPVAFWYFSLAGGISLFVYAAIQKDLVIMLGQALSCVIYLRNLNLIYSRANRRRRAGLPDVGRESVTEDEEEVASNRAV